MARRLGINPNSFRRRQGGPPPNLVIQAIGFVVDNWQKIPLKQIAQ